MLKTEITVDGVQYLVQYNPGTKDVFFKGTNRFKNERALLQLFTDLVQKNAKTLANSTTVTVAETTFQDSLLEATLPDPTTADVAHAPLDVPGKALVAFGFQKPDLVHTLDTLQPQRTNQTATYENAKTTTETLSNGKEVKEKDIRETIDGVHLGTAPRRNYSMKVVLQDGMQKFFGRETFISRDLFAKNSPQATGAITSSYNRFAPTVAMMRAVAAEDRTIDYYTGRVDSLEKATELASFMFQAECSNQVLENGALYTFPFAVQSLLDMVGPERALYEREVQAYTELKNTIVNVRMPGNITVQVRFEPVSVAANQFNYMNTAEQLLPDALSGKAAADAAQEQADQQLIDLARAKGSTTEMEAAIYFLEHKSSLKPWQVIMNRAYLCHLLNLPLVVHCKSSVDRTGIAGGMITAMKQWLRAGKAVPQVDGRAAIHEIVNVRIDDQGKESNKSAEQQIMREQAPTYEPFKELFAYAVTKELKCTELSRGISGYKWHRGVGQHPALMDLMPAGYFSAPKVSFWSPLLSALKTLAVIIVSIIIQALVLALILLIPLAAYKLAQKNIGKTLPNIPALLVAPMKFLYGYLSDVLEPIQENQLDESWGLLEPKGSSGGA